MDFQFTVVCALASHGDFFETVEIYPEIYRGFNLALDIQKSHDARCHCATHIGNIYKVEPEYPGESFPAAEDALGHRFGAEIGLYDIWTNTSESPCNLRKTSSMSCARLVWILRLFLLSQLILLQLSFIPYL
ncbi:hypothetical protein DFH09DRAFT_1314202 [Mycena vulgaris]|nr:hypothetical protein DFH09DRAFT_1314202 [Mycena vulgaris]